METLIVYTGTFITYMLKSAVCLVAFYLCYKLMFSRETFHRLNRFVLLGMLGVAFLLPAVGGEADGEAATAGGSAAIEADALSAEVLAALPAAEESAYLKLHPDEAVILTGFFLYLAGGLFFLGRNLWAFGRVWRLTKSGIRKGIGDYLPEGYLEGKGKTPAVKGRYRLTVTGGNQPPFSWMNHIVISQTDLTEYGAEILAHELAHVQHRHSLDLLLADLCILLQWFNPAAWLIKAELQNVHEFEADAAVLRHGIDAKQYQLLLIKKAAGARLYSIANSFNHSSLKQRITMMMRKKSNPWARAKYTFVLPLAAVAVAAFARPEVSALSDEISSASIRSLSMLTESRGEHPSVSATQGVVKVEGTIVDEATGQPMYGVSVLERGTTRGTLSDKNGRFVLPVFENAVIVLSYIGKQTYSFIASAAEVEKLKKTPVKMRDDVQHTDEIVVVGYAAEEPSNKAEAANAEAAKTVGTSANQQPEEDEAVFIVVEQMPEFPGGIKAMGQYIARNIKYPTQAQKANIEGQVIVQFVVGVDGYTSDFTVIRGVSPALDAEAIRVLAQMPKWTPGMQRGKAVPVKYTVPVTFKLEKQQPAKEHTTLSVPTLNIVQNASWKNILVLIDGKAISSETVPTLDPKSIKSVSVVKDSLQAQDLCKKYGITEKKNGVLLITTKKQ